MYFQTIKIYEINESTNQAGIMLISSSKWLQYLLKHALGEVLTQLISDDTK